MKLSSPISFRFSLANAARTILFVGAIFLCAGQAFAQPGDGEATPEHDERIKKALDRLDLKYTIQSNGTFKLIFTLEDDRTQIVNIRSTTYDFRGLEIREISAPAVAYDDEKSYGRDILYDVLERNNANKIGAFQMNGGTAPFILEFGLRISATSNDSTLMSMLSLAASAADEVELLYTKADKY